MEREDRKELCKLILTIFVCVVVFVAIFVGGVVGLVEFFDVKSASEKTEHKEYKFQYIQNDRDEKVVVDIYFQGRKVGSIKSGQTQNIDVEVEKGGPKSFEFRDSENPMNFTEEDTIINNYGDVIQYVIDASKDEIKVEKTNINPVLEYLDSDLV